MIIAGFVVTWAMMIFIVFRCGVNRMEDRHVIWKNNQKRLMDYMRLLKRLRQLRIAHRASMQRLRKRIWVLEGELKRIGSLVGPLQ